MINIVKKDENISASILTLTTVTLFTYTVPAKAILRFKKFSNYSDLVGSWALLMWSILKNGIVVNPYGVIRDQLGLPSRPEEIQPGEFHGGEVLTITVTNETANTVAMGIRIVYEVEEGERESGISS